MKLMKKLRGILFEGDTFNLSENDSTMDFLRILIDVLVVNQSTGYRLDDFMRELNEQVPDNELSRSQANGVLTSLTNTLKDRGHIEKTTKFSSIAILFMWTLSKGYVSPELYQLIGVMSMYTIAYLFLTYDNFSRESIIITNIIKEGMIDGKITS